VECDTPKPLSYRAAGLPFAATEFNFKCLDREAAMRVAIVTTAIGLAIASPATAFETPQDGSAANYLGAAAHGPGYKVDPAVPSDGFLRMFTFQTSYGPFAVDGVELAKRRVHELQALHRLNQMQESDVFTKSLGQAAMAPIRYGADLVTNPGATLNRTVTGIGNMFDRIGAGIDNQKSSRDSVASSLMGTDTARRQLAAQLSIDPYTEFQPLAQRLDTIAQASALGGLSVKAMLMAVPGAGGAIVSSSSTASSIENTLRDKTSAQIVQQVKAMLQRMNVSAASSARLLNNRLYTPADLLIMTSALARLKAGKVDLFVARAAQADTRDVAYFQRRRAELLAARSAELGGITEFVSIAGFPLNRTSDGTIVALFPLDDVTWTENSARAFAAVTEGLRQLGDQQSPVLATTAAVTPMAEQELKKLGWTIVALR
jgi:hypothetical protein